MIDKSLYIHKLEEQMFNEMMDIIMFQDDIMFYYKNYTEKMRDPDLLGKTVKVTEKQFSNIFKMVNKISKFNNMETPEVFIYEDFYYGVESKGIDKPRIEISAKTLVDFTDKELMFLIGKELCDIHLKHTYHYALINEFLEIVSSVNVVGIDTLSKCLKVKMCKWSRVSNFTSDAFGYVVNDDIQAAISAIKKLILNNCYLADNMNLSQYIKQASDINAKDDDVHNYSKQDELIPYGQFRIKNLISYASSDRGIQAVKEKRRYL